MPPKSLISDLSARSRRFPFAEIAGLFSEIVIVHVLYVLCVSKIPQIDNRDIFYTYLLYRHNRTNIEGTYFKL